MRAIDLLSVCGSGTCTSSMLTNRMKEVLENAGYRVNADEAAGGGVDLATQTRHFDIIAFTCPIDPVPGVITLDATGYLVGINEEEFEKKLLDAAASLDLGK